MFLEKEFFSKKFPRNFLKNPHPSLSLWRKILYAEIFIAFWSFQDKLKEVDFFFSENFFFYFWKFDHNNPARATWTNKKNRSPLYMFFVLILLVTENPRPWSKNCDFQGFFWLSLIRPLVTIQFRKTVQKSFFFLWISLQQQTKVCWNSYFFKIFSLVPTTAKLLLMANSKFHSLLSNFQKCISGVTLNKICTSVIPVFFWGGSV